MMLVPFLSSLGKSVGSFGKYVWVEVGVAGHRWPCRKGKYNIINLIK